MKRVALFVDVQNIYYTTRDAYGQNFDYNAFWAAATQGREVVKAFAYAVEKGDEKQQQFQNILRGIGFEVRLKRYLQRLSAVALKAAATRFLPIDAALLLARKFG